VWSSFDTSGFGPDDLRLADDMVAYWGHFIRDGRPRAADSARWTRYNRAQQTLSLRAGGRSVLISDAEIAADHHCGFWDAVGPAPARSAPGRR
jgi:hypothetical protein